MIVLRGVTSCYRQTSWHSEQWVLPN